MLKFTKSNLFSQNPFKIKKLFLTSFVHPKINYFSKIQKLLVNVSLSNIICKKKLTFTSSQNTHFFEYVFYCVILFTCQNTTKYGHE